MARRVVVKLIDDVDGSDAVELVRFSLDGVSYEIDLNQEHADELRAEISRWAVHGRKVAGRRIRNVRSNTGDDPSAIRAWAKSRGIVVSDRGRVPAEVRDAYAEAKGS